MILFNNSLKLNSSVGNNISSFLFLITKLFAVQKGNNKVSEEVEWALTNTR